MQHLRTSDSQFYFVGTIFKERNGENMKERVTEGQPALTAFHVS